MSTTPPTTASEALALAWELAHPVKEGQVIPEDTRFLIRDEDGFLSEDWMVHEEPNPITVFGNIRTLDPLPEPLPDWLDAPAVMARVKGWVSCADPQVFSRENKAGTQWLLDTKVYRWDELEEVTPLYPKG